LYQNLHTHTNFSDGSDSPEKYIEAAIASGMTSIGFSDHSPLPFENSFALREDQVQNYCDTILDAKCKMQSAKCKMQIFLGMEADFIPGMGHSFAWFREKFPLDFLIGSVHLVKNGKSTDLWFIDGPDPATYDEGLDRLFGGDIRKGVTTYYRQINEMLATSKMEIIGHLDKIKMHNRGRLFSENESWYVALVDETLDLIKQTGVIVEVNTRGIYKKRSDSHFPGPALLKKIHAMNIPVILSSDAHKPAEISMLFGETADLLIEIGFRQVMELTPSGWTAKPLIK